MPGGTKWLRVILAAPLLCLFLLGCGRTLTTVELAPMSFIHKGAPIDGTIELCLTPELRTRQWNVRDHGFKIELGSRAALNLERLAKSAFQRVVVSFERDCGSSTDHPWLEATIVAANRDYDSIWASEQNTTITMKFDLSDDAGRSIWTTTTRGNVTQSPALWSRRRIRAAEAFGEALALALDRAFEELVESEAVRNEFGVGPFSPEPPTDTETDIDSDEPS